MTILNIEYYTKDELVAIGQILFDKINYLNMSCSRYNGCIFCPHRHLCTDMKSAYFNTTDLLSKLDKPNN